MDLGPLTKMSAQSYHAALDRVELGVLSHAEIQPEDLKTLADLRYRDGIYRSEVSLSNPTTMTVTVSHMEMLQANSSKFWCEVFNPLTCAAVLKFMHDVIDGQVLNTTEIGNENT